MLGEDEDFRAVRTAIGLLPVPRQAGVDGTTEESGCRTVDLGHPNGAPQIPPFHFAVGMTERRGWLKGKGPLPRDRAVSGGGTPAFSIGYRARDTLVKAGNIGNACGGDGSWGE